MEINGRFEVACEDVWSDFVVRLFEYFCCLNLGYSL